MEAFLQSIIDDVKNIFSYDIETTHAYVVPTRHDSALTFQINADRKGKLLETCVLFIDIRNSTKISRDLKKDKIRLGKIYSAFIYAMTKIADEYGYVRNIVGDRVMVVFEPKDCFVNALNCATLMYTVAYKIIKPFSKIEDFKIGIGVDYGEMLVLKTGITRRHEEQSEYKSLVWVGDTANSASKLTDFANKQYYSPLYKLTYEEIVYKKVLKEVKPTLPPLWEYFPQSAPLPEYEDKWVTENRVTSINMEEFNRKIEWGNEIKYNGKKVVSISKEVRSDTTSPVLISGKVYNEFKKADPTSPLIAKLSSKDYPEKPYTGTGIYGGYLLLPDHAKIKL